MVQVACEDDDATVGCAVSYANHLVIYSYLFYGVGILALSVMVDGR
jgi:hypothetical protein